MGRRGPHEGATYGRKPGPVPKKATGVLVPITSAPTHSPPVPDGLGELGRQTWLDVWAGLPPAVLDDQADYLTVTRLCEAADDRAAARHAVEALGMLLEEPIVTPTGIVAGTRIVPNPAVEMVRKLDKVIDVRVRPARSEPVRPGSPRPHRVQSPPRRRRGSPHRFENAQAHRRVVVTTATSQQILAAFDSLSPATRLAVAGSLKADANTFARALGNALSTSSHLGKFVVSQAIAASQFDGSADRFAESLSDEEPWSTVRRLIRLAVQADADERAALDIWPEPTP